MTRERERLIEIMNCHADADTERLADAILAEMAGDWNAAIDQCIAKTRGVLDKNPDGIVWRTKTVGEVVLAIQTLRRPDAAPAQTAEPIPAGVHYVAELANFYYDENHRGCGEAFYRLWKSRWKEFPTCPAKERPWARIDIALRGISGSLSTTHWCIHSWRCRGSRDGHSALTIGLQSDARVEADMRTVEHLVTELRSIARPHDCGCVPCRGQCRTQEALEIWIDELQHIARTAIVRHEAAAAARPVSQAGEVADILRDLREAIAEGAGSLATACVDIITAQVAEIERLKRERDFAIAAHDGQVQDKDCIAGWLAAKDAEIAALKSDLKCETDRYAALVASDTDKITAQDARIAELEAALRPFAEIYDPRVMLNMNDLRRARAALAPAGEEVKP